MIPFPLAVVEAIAACITILALSTVAILGPPLGPTGPTAIKTVLSHVDRVILAHAAVPSGTLKTAGVTTTGRIGSPLVPVHRTTTASTQGTAGAPERREERIEAVSPPGGVSLVIGAPSGIET